MNFLRGICSMKPETRNEAFPGFIALLGPHTEITDGCNRVVKLWYLGNPILGPSLRVEGKCFPHWSDLETSLLLPSYKGWWTHRNHITSTASVLYQCVLHQCVLYHGFKIKCWKEVWQLWIPERRSQSIWKGSFC